MNLTEFLQADFGLLESGAAQPVRQRSQLDVHGNGGGYLWRTYTGVLRHLSRATNLPRPRDARLEEPGDGDGDTFPPASSILRPILWNELSYRES